LTRYNLNDLRGALDDLDRVISLDPNNELAYFNRGLIRSQVGDLNRLSKTSTKSSTSILIIT
jgi:lipoprotein NlpI